MIPATPTSASVAQVSRLSSVGGSNIKPTAIHTAPIIIRPQEIIVMVSKESYTVIPRFRVDRMGAACLDLPPVRYGASYRVMA